MSITPATLTAIQQAGQTIDAARKALTDAVAEQAQRVMQAVAEQPFSVDNDKLFAHWKTTARLAQEVQSIEGQFKTLYETALALAEPETPVLTALPASKASRKAPGPSSYALDTSTAEDVEVKARPARAPARPAAPVKAAAAPARKARVAGAATGSGRLSINDQLVLTFLNKSLQRKQWRRLSHSAMAQGAGIPLGSVGLALRRLMAGGHVLEGEKGHYKRG